MSETVPTAGKQARKRRQSFPTIPDLQDILPRAGAAWRAVTSVLDDVADLYQFFPLETPIVESAELLRNGLSGTETVHGKLMTFRVGKQEVALRHEGVIPLLRSYMEHHLGHVASPLRVTYRGPFYAAQGSRLVARHEQGFAIVGEPLPFYDVDVIMALLESLRRLGFTDHVVHINAVGCRVCRPAYYRRLKAYFGGRKGALCESCKARVATDPVSIFRCERPGCIEVREGAPVIFDHLCQSCNAYFQGFLEYLEGNELNYHPEPYLLGDFDYYNRIVFSISPFADNNTPPLAAGGRCDYLVERIGGRQLTTVAGTMFLERVIGALSLDPETFFKRRGVFFIAVGDEARRAGSRIVALLRKSQFTVLEAVGKKTLQGQLKAAEKSGMPLALMYGQREVFEDVIIVRDIASNTQRSIPLEHLLAEVRKHFSSRGGSAFGGK